MTIWTQLAQGHGRKCVMSLSITDAELDAETERQSDVLYAMLAPLFTSSERRVLDFGCGAGRMIPLLYRLASQAWITGYDPCAELLHEAPIKPDWRLTYRSDLPPAGCDVVYCHGVLGNPDSSPDSLARQIVDMLNFEGLLILIDHMTDEPPQGAWWCFRPVAFYQDLFAGLGMRLSFLGTDRQLGNPITVLVGRR